MTRPTSTSTTATLRSARSPTSKTTSSARGASPTRSGRAVPGRRKPGNVSWASSVHCCDSGPPLEENMTTKKQAGTTQTGTTLKFFGWKLPVSDALARRIEIFGIQIPAAGIAVVVGLTLIAITVLGIFFSRAPQNISQHIEHRYDVASPQFTRSMSVLLGPALEPGNRIEPLINGDRIFPAMLQAIRSARRSVDFESYIYWKGEVGKQFAAALAETARKGVKVHVLLDWAGSHKMDQAYINEMGAAGVEILKYHRPQWYRLKRLNNRTHRKLLIVDGTVGFTGGVGIA